MREMKKGRKKGEIWRERDRGGGVEGGVGLGENKIFDSP